MSDLPSGAAIVVLGAGAVGLARRLRAVLPGSSLHAPVGKGIAADRLFDRPTDHVATLFGAATPIVGICAAGILIRAVAGLLDDKRSEPPVIAVAEDGSAVVPLLGGHRGANRLARAIASAIGGAAAITTAGDLVLGFALDEPPAGWHVANPERAKPIAAALLAGVPVALSIDAGTADWLTSGAVRFDATAALRIRVTDCIAAAADGDLILHPPVLALGVGCERGCTAEELSALADSTLFEHGLAAAAVAVVVSLDLKADERAVHALAARLGVPARFFTAEELRVETPRLAMPSEAVFCETGCYGVAEGAALAAVGPDGALIVPKRKSRRATCAVARAATPFPAEPIGRPQGTLAIVGIGPGDPSWRTPAASAALDSATDIVGYTLYLDLLGPTIAGKARHATGLGSETERARRALDLASSGRSVALVSSGDAGIYGLASLVFELIDREDRPAWRRVALNVIPGVSALQAAAARAGAPLGHDFCAISLSDLLTPWPTIERRLTAAAAGDFVVALYNPRSARRATQLATARSILLAHRAADTPVAVARNLGRADESLTLTTLAELDPEIVDMLTLVLVGNSETRLIPGREPRIYTPRGYEAKTAKPGGTESSA
ncbi:MAG TPA: precorrin-3B C(17)-methyltransferase [Stellaceae bacterium]|jgi:cobalt-precorrin 5A hydrolase/precorrin-3B C17-methyltransferase|nr:precorrin-3B C(17)-methyltransferase [Stellaceae bacterium]